MQHLKESTKATFQKAISHMEMVAKKAGLPPDFDIIAMTHVALLDYALYIISCGDEVTQDDCDLLGYVFEFPVEIHEAIIYIEKDPSHREHAEKISSFYYFVDQIDTMTKSNKQNIQFIQNIYDNIGNSFVMSHKKEDTKRRYAHKKYIKMMHNYVSE